MNVNISLKFLSKPRQKEEHEIKNIKKIYKSLSNARFIAPFYFKKPSRDRAEQ